jgi:hypothetical protein
MKNAVHAEEVPSSYDLEILPLSRAWDEGRGFSIYDEGLKDINQYSNWRSATSVQSWTTPGGDVVLNPTSSQHFDEGMEDLDIDISNIVYSWLTGGLVNNGILVKFQNQYESGTIDYAFKHFYSRHAKLPERRPKIVGFWKKTIQDDRTNMSFNLSGSLMYYKSFGGVPSTQSPLFVRIENSSGSLLQILTASIIDVAAGVHEASGVFVPYNTGSFICKDVWFSGNVQYFTGTFFVDFASGSSGDLSDSIDVNITNIQSYYNSGEKSILRVFIKDKDYRPAVVSKSTLIPTPNFIKNAYYEIRNSKNDQIMIPFSTGSIQYSKLSYDMNGHYFEFWTDSLPKDNIYKIKIMIDLNGQRIIFDKNWLLNVK